MHVIGWIGVQCMRAHETREPPWTQQLQQPTPAEAAELATTTNPAATAEITRVGSLGIVVVSLFCILFASLVVELLLLHGSGCLLKFFQQCGPPFCSRFSRLRFFSSARLRIGLIVICLLVINLFGLSFLPLVADTFWSRSAFVRILLPIALLPLPLPLFLEPSSCSSSSSSSPSSLSALAPPLQIFWSSKQLSFVPKGESDAGLSMDANTCCAKCLWSKSRWSSLKQIPW